MVVESRKRNVQGRSRTPEIYFKPDFIMCPLGRLKH
jgi:hypothetical protein